MLEAKIKRALDLMSDSDTMSLTALVEGDVLAVQTKRSLYTFVMKDSKGGATATSSNPKFRGPIEGRINGTRLNFNGKIIANQQLYPGGFLEFVFVREVCPETGLALRDELVTTDIQAIFVNDVQILPTSPTAA